MKIKRIMIIFFLVLTIVLNQKVFCSNDTNEIYDHNSFISDFYDIGHLIIDEEYKQANQDAQTLLNKAVETFGNGANETANVRRLFTVTNIHIKNYKKAKEIMYQSLRTQKKDNIFYVIDLIFIAISYELEGNIKESDSLYKESIDLTRTIYGQKELQKKLLEIIGYFENFDIFAKMEPIKNLIGK